MYILFYISWSSVLYRPSTILSKILCFFSFFFLLFQHSYFQRIWNSWTSNSHRYSHTHTSAGFAFSSGESRSITRVLYVCTDVQMYRYTYVFLAIWRSYAWPAYSNKLFVAFLLFVARSKVYYLPSSPFFHSLFPLHLVSSFCFPLFLGQNAAMGVLNVYLLWSFMDGPRTVDSFSNAVLYL